MGRLVVRIVALALLAAGVGFAVRAVLAGRAPQRSVDGSGPILGSLDTWPSVPRKEPAD